MELRKPDDNGKLEEKPKMQTPRPSTDAQLLSTNHGLPTPDMTPDVAPSSKKLEDWIPETPTRPPLHRAEVLVPDSPSPTCKSIPASNARQSSLNNRRTPVKLFTRKSPPPVKPGRCAIEGCIAPSTWLSKDCDRKMCKRHCIEAGGCDYGSHKAEIRSKPATLLSMSESSHTTTAPLDSVSSRTRGTFAGKKGSNRSKDAASDPVKVEPLSPRLPSVSVERENYSISQGCQRNSVSSCRSSRTPRGRSSESSYRHEDTSGGEEPHTQPSDNNLNPPRGYEHDRRAVRWCDQSQSHTQTTTSNGKARVIVKCHGACTFKFSFQIQSASNGKQKRRRQSYVAGKLRRRSY